MLSTFVIKVNGMVKTFGTMINQNLEASSAMVS